MPFHEMKRDLAVRIASHLSGISSAGAGATGISGPKISEEELLGEFGHPPTIALGHVALPCFKLSKLLGEPSDEIAKRIADHFSKAASEKNADALPDGVTVSAAGPYLNFRWKSGALYLSVLEQLFREKEKYGSDRSGATHRIVLEYGSPNIGKRLGFSDLRGAIIGNALGNVYEFLGYRTERINFVGDWGNPFAKLLAAFEMWGEKSILSAASTTEAMKHLLAIYVKYHRLVDEHPEYEMRAAIGLQKLEQGDPEASATWKLIREVSLKSIEGTLARLNVKFHHVESESQYVRATADLLTDVKRKAGARLSEGAWIVDIEGVPTPALVQKRDGTTLYLTRDLSAALDRRERFKAEKMYYIVSEQQYLHFQLLFGVLKKMGHDWASTCEHLKVGPSTTSIRESRYLALDDLLDEARSRALVECLKRTPDLADRDEVAERVAIAAVVFGIFSVERESAVELKWETLLAWDGETGPYVQACLALCVSVLGKAAAKGELPGIRPGDDTLAFELAPEEEALVLMLSKFRSHLHHAIGEGEPRHVSVYLIDLAKAFDRFYYRFPVLQATDATQRRLRLNLVEGTRQVLSSGLELLGIRNPREM